MVTIYTFCFKKSNRLHNVLPSIISQDQQGFIKNRCIGSNIRLIQDIIDYTELLNCDGAILLIDFKKAFDTIDWSFLFKSLKKFKFKECFIKWVNVMYSNITSVISNNGWISEPFNIKRGIRQGCPLSALLFVIVAEVLAVKIRSSNMVEGIQIRTENQTHTIKICQLADDTTLFLKNQHEITASLHIIEEYGIFSGLQLNRNKTEGLWLGRLRNIDLNMENITFTNTFIKTLGVYFGHDHELCSRLNWEVKLNQIKEQFKKWGNAKSYLFWKKNIVIKSVLLPKVIYIIQNTFNSKKYLNTLNSLFYTKTKMQQQ